MSTIEPRLERCIKLQDGTNEYFLTHPPYTIGRSRKCQIVVFDPDMVVSGIHAEIVNEHDKLYIIDRSRNGTYLNQKRITLDQKVALAHEVVIGFVYSHRTDFQYFNEGQTNESSEYTILREAKGLLIMKENQFFLRGMELELSEKEYLLLEILYKETGIVDRSKIRDTVFKEDPSLFDKGRIDKLVDRLRKKLNDTEHHILQTKRGRGFQLVIPKD